VTEQDPFVGRTLAGRYDVLKKLNQGGVGAVYLAMQRPLDRPVALKLLLRQHADDPTARKRFEKEASSIARLAHAHIITVYDFGTTEDGDRYLAMEFLRGQSLRDLLDSARWLPWERALHIIVGVTRALVAAHTQKIIHRDLKPDNIMVVESNGDLDFAKVLDFGLARSIEGPDAEQKITRHDVIPGTPAYLSPERVQGVANDPRSDLYALGAVFFELLCGEPPFPGETSIKVILSHLHEPPRRPSTVRPENAIPPAVDDLVLALLEKTPERRPPSATALLQRLHELIPATSSAGTRAASGGPAPAAIAVPTAAPPAEPSGHAPPALGEPVPLVKRKVPSTTTTTTEPVLLTRKKSGASSPDGSPPAAPSTTMASRGLPPSEVEAADDTVKSPPAERGDAPTQPPASWNDDITTNPDEPPLVAAKRHPTEEFLRLTSAEQDAHIAALHDAGAAGIPARIESVAVAAGWLGTARTVRAVGELCAAFFASRFERVVVLDVRSDAPVVLARAGLSIGIDVGAAAAQHPGLWALGERREATYGPSLDDDDWTRWYSALGGPAPGAHFIAGLQREGALAFVFYADHRDVALRPSVKDTSVLLREAAAALSLLE
jgi:serine/threonine-protein kinase